KGGRDFGSIEDSQASTGPCTDIEQSAPFFKSLGGLIHYLRHLGQNQFHGIGHFLVLIVDVGHNVQSLHFIQSVVQRRLFGNLYVFFCHCYNNCMFIFLNASSLVSQGSNSVIRASMSSTPHILYRCIDPIFSDMQGDTTFLELWIMAFFIWTISQSNSVNPSVGWMEFVPKKQISTLISESMLMALPPIAI